MGGEGGGPDTALHRPLMALALRWLASFLLATSLPSQVTERLLPHDFPSCKAPTEASNAPQSGPHQAGQSEHHDRDAWPLSGVGQILSTREFQNN